MEDRICVNGKWYVAENAVTQTVVKNVDCNNVTRIEVIDAKGRSYVKKEVAINLSLQDDNRTLKIFVESRPEK